jgi:hypothetical protein
MYEITRQRRVNKKGIVFAAFLLALTAGAFYGCQLLQPKDNASELSDQMPLYRRIGILKSLGGVRTSNSGTHLLQLDDGDTILLKSLQINMDDPAYLGKSVEVRGILTYTTDKKQIMEVMNIDLVQEEADMMTQETSWKELNRADMGFSIKYRDDMKLESGNTKITFMIEPVATAVTPEPVATMEETDSTGSSATDSQQKAEDDKNLHKLIIGRAEMSEGQDIYEFAGVKSGESELLAAGVSRSRIGSGSYDALKKVEGNITTYYIQADKNVYTVILDAGSDETTLQDQNLFYEMLATMKIETASSLTQETDTANNSTQSETEESSDTEQTTQASTDTQEATEQDDPLKDAVSVTEVPKAEIPDLNIDIAALENYEKMESESFKFTMQYPKSWFYSGSAGSEDGVIRHYEFGSKPLEEVPGDVSMDLMSGSIPSGSTSSVNGKEIVVVETGSGVELYVKGSGSRVYRFTGPSQDKSTLMNMAASISE